MNHSLAIKTYYEDTDFSGVVYHASYLRFAERGRSEFLAQAGISHQALLKRTPPLAFVVRRMEIDFIAPAYVEESLSVTTKLTQVKGVQFLMAQEVKRDEQVLFAAKVDCALIDPSRAKPSRTARDIMDKLKGVMAQ